MTTMRPRVLVVDHYDSYTWNLAHLVAAVTGVLPRVVQHDQDPDLSGCTHLVLSPGPGRPDDAGDNALGRRAFEAGVPVLGVCLGMQALVVGFGGTVAAVEPAHGEIAAIRHDGAGVFTGLPQDFAAVRYHSLAAITVPEPLVVTATSAGATGEAVVMGVRHRRLPLHGVQFHPESVLTEHGRPLVANFLEAR